MGQPTDINGQIAWARGVAGQKRRLAARHASNPRAAEAHARQQAMAEAVARSLSRLKAKTAAKSNGDPA